MKLTDLRRELPQTKGIVVDPKPEIPKDLVYPLTDKLDFDELSSMQIAALKAIANGKVDFEGVSDRMMEVIEELQIHGLVNSDYKLNAIGQKAIELAAALGGGRERRQAARKGPEMELDGDVYNDDYSPSRDPDESIYSPNLYGTGNPHV
jgi:hypothetical protein